jgi:choline kinase
MKILFMAAGMSSRFGGEPKMLAQIGPNYESLLEITLLQIKNHIDISSIHFILNKKSKEIILKEVENIKIKHNLNVNVSYNIQIIPEERIKPWGTADALASCYNDIKEPVLILNSDDLYDEKSFKLIKYNCDYSKNYIIGFKLKQTLVENKPANRGFIYTDSDNKIYKIQEKLNIKKSDFNEKELSETFVSVNLFYFQSSVLCKLYDMVEEFKKKNNMDLNIEALLPNFINTMIENNIFSFELLPTVDSVWKGITFKQDVEIVRKSLQENNYKQS